jgi:hypothetical protein
LFTRAGSESAGEAACAGISLDALAVQIVLGMDGKRREETGSGEQEKRARGAEDIDIAGRRAESRSRVSAMHSSNHKKQLVKSSCHLLIDPCAGAYLRPLRDTQFEFVGTFADLELEIRETMISVAEAARRISLRPKTLYCWIECERLRKEHGLRPCGKRYRIEWRVFKACLDRGDFAGSDASCS